MRFSFAVIQKLLHKQSSCCASLRSGQPTKKSTPVGRRSLRQNQDKFIAKYITLPRQHGFTLIEIIIGIVALSISLAIVGSFLDPAEQHSADQVQQIKAAALGQGMLDEILGRAFDENSDMVGSHWRCNETGRTACSTTLTAEESDRSQYDDVDDYNGFNLKVTSTNNNLDASFTNFQINVNVAYAGSDLGLSNNNLAKRVTVTITTPLGTAIDFTGYKANF